MIKWEWINVNKWNITCNSIIQKYSKLKERNLSEYKKTNPSKRGNKTNWSFEILFTLNNLSKKQQASSQNILIYSYLAKIVNSPLSSSMQLLTVSNKITKPQDGFVFRPMSGVDKDGETIRVVDMETEFKNNYFVLFFFPLDFEVDSSEVLSFK